jgi:PEP-CTERM motif
MRSVSSRRWRLFLSSQSAKLLGASALLLAVCGVSNASVMPFLPGDLVVTRAAGGPHGDESAPLTGSGTAAAVFVDEYLPNGTLRQTIAMPDTTPSTPGGQRAFTYSGTQNNEGNIVLSTNGQYLTMLGYDQTATVAGTNSAASNVVARVIARIDMNGNVDTSTALTDVGSAQSVRNAISDDGTHFWVMGNGGNAIGATTTTNVHYVSTLGATTSVQLSTANPNANRVLNAFNGTLYVSNQATATNRGVNTYVGFPTAATATPTLLPGFSAGSASNQPDDFWFKDANTLYVADQRAFVAATGATQAGGIQKWSFVDTNSDSIPDTWQLQYTLPVGSIVGNAAVNSGAHGLAGTIDGSGNAVLYVTTFDNNGLTGPPAVSAGANSTNLVTITDTGSGSLPTILATSATNSAFRGVEIIPAAVSPEPASLALLSLGGIAMLRRRKNV